MNVYSYLIAAGQWHNYPYYIEKHMIYIKAKGWINMLRCVLVTVMWCWMTGLNYIYIHIMTNNGAAVCGYDWDKIYIAI